MRKNANHCVKRNSFIAFQEHAEETLEKANKEIENVTRSQVKCLVQSGTSNLIT